MSALDQPEILDLRRSIVIAGHEGNVHVVVEALGHDHASIREAALGAMVRTGQLTTELLTSHVADPDPRVRTRVAELGADFRDFDEIPLLQDPDPLVVEMAAWACGEHEDPRAEVIAELARITTAHDDALVREAAVAALGAIGNDNGLPAILHACNDKPAIRRRAVLALAPFDTPEVEAALRLALEDRDWQVRQAAEDLLG